MRLASWRCGGKHQAGAVPACACALTSLGLLRPKRGLRRCRAHAADWAASGFNHGWRKQVVRRIQVVRRKSAILPAAFIETEGAGGIENRWV